MEAGAAGGGAAGFAAKVALDEKVIRLMQKSPEVPFEPAYEPFRARRRTGVRCLSKSGCLDGIM